MTPTSTECCCGPDWRRAKPNGTCATCGGWLPGEQPPSLVAMWRGTASDAEPKSEHEAVTDEMVERAAEAAWQAWPDDDEPSWTALQSVMPAALRAALSGVDQPEESKPR